MCGFVVVVGKSGNVFPFNMLKGMTDAIYHRGPDDEGYLLFQDKKYFDIRTKNRQLYVKGEDDTLHQPIDTLYGNLLFGFRRLSIIDLSELGHQPMQLRDRYWVVFNGEIYNYKELREELIRLGHVFISQTDTEVLLAAFDQWGVNSFNRFNGMWSFVIYDIHEQKLIVSRDRFGEKPLYYYEDNNFLILASEIKSIHKAIRSSLDINIQFGRNFIEFGDNSFHDETFLSNVFRFPSASYSVIEVNDVSNKIRSTEHYWNLTINKDISYFDGQKIECFAERYTELLSDAVRIRCQADVKIGAALSGGLDSSSIVYFIKNSPQINMSDLSTFSNIYENDRLKHIDESVYIKELWQFLGVNGNAISPKDSEIMSVFSDMIYHADLPTNSSNISGWYTYKLTKSKNTTVTLDGQGADELLAGYSSYYTVFLANTPSVKLLKEIRGANNNFTASDLFKAAIMSLKIKMQNYLRSRSFKALKLNKYSGTLNEVLQYDMRYNLSNLLRYGDFLSMAHSVESRLPFLDVRLVEFLFGINSSFKIHDGWTKYISRYAMREKLPSKIVWRKDKIGWANADEYWFGELYKDQVDEIISNSNLIKELLSVNQYRQLKKLPIAKRIRLLNIALWETRFV